MFLLIFSLPLFTDWSSRRSDGSRHKIIGAVPAVPQVSGSSSRRRRSRASGRGGDRSLSRLQVRNYVARCGVGRRKKCFESRFSMKCAKMFIFDNSNNFGFLEQFLCYKRCTKYTKTLHEVYFAEFTVTTKRRPSFSYCSLGRTTASWGAW
jgi:hypothetical protein